MKWITNSAIREAVSRAAAQQLREGTIRRGGSKLPPKTPKPDITTAPQNPLRAKDYTLEEELSAIEDARYSGAESVPLEAAEALEAYLREATQSLISMERALDSVRREGVRP